VTIDIHFLTAYRALRLSSVSPGPLFVKEILMGSIIRLSFIAILLSVSPIYAQDSRQLTQETPNSTPTRRLALVIGNSSYTNAPPLKNPANDASDMATALSGLGFSVEHGVNLTQRQMKSMIRAFGQKLKDGGQGLFYYAGHGVQLNGRNYLIPIDADIQSEADVEDQGVDAALMLRLMDEAGNGLNVVILDACRNNPFARSFRSSSNGLAQMDAPGGTLIAYATAPGSVASDGNARNGLYTQELLRFMRAPGLEVEDVFKQVRISVRNLTQGKQTPWESSSLVGDFYFSRGGPPKTLSSSQGSITTVDPAAIELSYWDTIKNSTDPEDFRGYLARYPNGRFAELAKRRAQAKVSPEPGGPIISGCNNLLLNGSIQGSLAGWKVVNFTRGAITEVVQEGGNAVVSMSHSGNKDWSSISQEIRSKLRAGQIYIFSFRYRSLDSVKIGIRFADSSTVMHSNGIKREYWENALLPDGSCHADAFEFTVTSSHPRADEPMFGIFFDYNNTGNVFIDDVILAEKGSNCHIQ
jgi:Caspase domain/Carbohydrate binding domain